MSSFAFYQSPFTTSDHSTNPRPPPAATSPPLDMPGPSTYPSFPPYFLAEQHAVLPPYSLPPSTSSSASFWSSALFPPTPGHLADPQAESYFQQASSTMGHSYKQLEGKSAASPANVSAEVRSWVTFPPASLSEIDGSQEDDNDHDEDNDHPTRSPSTASRSSFSLDPPVSEGESERSFKVVGEVDKKTKGGGKRKKAKREMSDHDKSGDEKGTTITEVLAEMGLTRAAYDKMTPSRKRQIRNKVSARAFRARKKSLVETLSAAVEEKDGVIGELRKKILALERENWAIKNKF